MSKPTMGLIAGGGRLPFLQAKGMRDAGHAVACVGLKDQYDPGLPELCDTFVEVGVLHLGRWCRQLRKRGATQAVMVGKVQKSQFQYHPTRWLSQMPDWRAARVWLWRSRHDRRSQTLMTSLADELKEGGLELIDTTKFIPEHMAGEGVLTSLKPTSQQQHDIDFVWPVLMRMNDLDIGQAVAVKKGDVIAVEAMEGTDAMIQRAGELCRKPGWLLAKGAPANKDPRFDVPTVGVQTIENLAKAGGTGLLVTAGRVILLDKPEVIAAADRLGITIAGRAAE
ncbi:MAG: UDP-2,3-diacylglucosamine diphosphatase LpxI [Planctomycetota bacterium]